MQILYDQTDGNLSNTPYYNGRISGVKWMSVNGSGTKSLERAFRYYYDGMARDTAAIYSERSGTGAFTVTHGWDENRISYDVGGNIKNMVRDSSVQGTGSHYAIDNLVYTYDSANPNRLLKVTDGTGSAYSNSGFRNRTGSTGNYTYDANGNLMTDPYKGLSFGNYNVLNRTDKITCTSYTGRYIDYTYDASGNLIRKRQYDNNTLVNTTDYIDGFVYLTAGAGSAALQYFPMPEGRVVYSGSTFISTYTISDHQGNVRVEFDGSGTGGTAKVLQENSYYAFGLIMPGSTVATPGNDNKNLYNGGSEWQKDYGNLPDYYQTFYRNYDAALGRWMGVDPMAESAESMNPYQYAGNNPIMFNDPKGDLIPYWHVHPDDDGSRQEASYSPIPYMGGDYMSAKFAQMDEWAAEDQETQNYFDYMNDLQGGGGQRAQAVARDQRINSPNSASAANNTANQLTSESYKNLHWNPYGGSEISEGWYKSLPGHAIRESYPNGAKFYAGAWEDENNNAVDANQGGYFMTYMAHFVNDYRTEGTLTLYDKYGNDIMEMSATSGSGGKKKGYTLPAGDYNVSNFRCTTDPKFMRKGNGFKIDIGPDFYDPLRGYIPSALEVHPARGNGTLGCVGLVGTSMQIQAFENMISQIFITQPSIPLHAQYGNNWQ